MQSEPTREKESNPRMLFDLADKLVWVAGQHGMVGGAVMRRLQRESCNLLLDPGRGAVDFRRQAEVEDWMASHRPRVVFLTAGRVGGMYANNAFPADFLYDNLLIEATSFTRRTAPRSRSSCSSVPRASIRAKRRSPFPKMRC